MVTFSNIDGDGRLGCPVIPCIVVEFEYVEFPGYKDKQAGFVYFK